MVLELERQLRRIEGLTELALERTAFDLSARNDLAEIRMASERARRLMRQLGVSERSDGKVP